MQSELTVQTVWKKTRIRVLKSGLAAEAGRTAKTSARCAKDMRYEVKP